MRSFLERFWRDRRGVSAVEFAFIAPVMMIIYVGLSELTMATMADRRNNHVASAVGDLVTQSSQVSTADMKDIFSIGDMIIGPFPSANLKLRVTSVTKDSKGQARVDWCDVRGMADLADNSLYKLDDDDLIGVGESIVVAEATYDYTSAFGNFNNTFSDKLFLKPRRAAKVLHS